MEEYGSHFARPCPPLLPHSKFLYSDLGPLISELFQDLSNNSIISPRAAGNLTETCNEYSDLYQFAWDIKEFFYRHQNFIELINKAEESLMLSHVNYINKELELSKDAALLERHRVSREPIFNPSDIPEEIINKLKLLQYKDILPKFIDYFDFNPEASESSKSQSIIKHQIIQNDLEKNINRHVKGKEKCRKEFCIPFLKIEPKKIIFKKFQRGKTYQKACHLFNTSNRSIRFVIDPYFNHSSFKIKTQNGLNKFVIAPGMKISLVITFQPENLLILHEKLKIDEYSFRGPKVLGCRHIIILEANIHPAILIESNFFLNFPEYIPPREDFEIIRSSTIECGKCFIGDCTCQKIILRNIGLGDGTFYLISESAWYLGKIKEFTLSNTLELDSFSIEPCYFSVRSGEFISLSAHFKPLSPGVHTQRLFILSENCTIRILDLVGDGLCFYQKYIHFQNIKRYSVEVEDDESVNYYIEVNEMNPNSRKNISFSIESLCPLPLRFRWEKRYANLLNFPISKNIGNIKFDCIKMTPKSGFLKPLKKILFDLNINLFDHPLGDHRIVFSFVIENIPMACFLEDSCKCKSTAPRFITQEPSLDVYLSEIEVFLHVKPVKVELSQPFLLFSETLKPLEPMESEISIYNPFNFPLICHWELNISSQDNISSLSIVPNFFILPGFTEVNCTFCITPTDQPGPFICKARCVLNYRESEIQIAIMGQVDKPNIEPSTNHLDFGVVPRGSRQKMNFKIQNKGLSEAIWLIREFVMDPKTKSFIEYPQTHLNHVSGIIKRSNINLQYDLDTMTPGFWVSILTLNIVSRDDNLAPLDFSSHILVTAFREESTLLIENARGNFNYILNLGDILYTNNEFQTKIILRNPGRCEALFKIGIPFGCHSYLLNLSFEPQSKKIPPLSSLEIEINILPKEQGYADHVYIPIWISYIRVPLIINLIAFIEGPHVTIDFSKCFDNNTNKFTTKVPWSIRGRLSPFFQLSNAEKEIFKTPCRCNEKYSFEPVNNKIPNVSLRLLENEDIIFEDPLEEAIKKEFEAQDLRPHGKPTPRHVSATCLCGPIAEIPPFRKISLKKQDIEQYEIGMCPDPNIYYNPDGSIGMIRSILRDYTRYSSSIDTSDQPFLLHSRPPPRRRFSPFSIYSDQENCENDFYIPFDYEGNEDKLTFSNEITQYRPAYLNSSNYGIQVGIFTFLDFDLQYRQASEKSFTIVNNTPIEINYRISLTNFCIKSNAVDSSLPNIIKKLAAEVRGLSIDAWKDQLGNCSPILFIINKDSGTLLPYEINEITIWAYSTTWGLYTDKLKIEMEGLPDFFIRLTAEVNAFPLELPALKSEKDHYLMRLGNVSCINSSSDRTIRIFNRSSIGIFLSWHFYQKLNTQPYPFNFIIDSVPCWEEKSSYKERFKKLFPLHLRLIDYHGIEINDIFQITPRDCIIPKYSEQKFKLKFNPSLFEKNSNFTYQLISYLEIDYKESLKVDHYMRPNFLLYDPLKILIQGKMEIPKLEINIESKQVSVSAFEIISSITPWNSEQFIYISNCSQVATYVTPLIEPPFFFSNIKNRFGIINIKKVNKILIEPDDILEVKIGCCCGRNQISEAIKYFKQNVTELNEIWAYHIKSLFRIKQYPENCQIVLLNLRIIFPILNPIPKVLEFDQVFIRNIKSSYFTIQNLGIVPIPYKIYTKFNLPNLTFKPESGILPPRQGQSENRHIIRVYFIPSEPIKYDDIIIIKTNIPGWEAKVIFSCIGSLNEKQENQIIY